MYPYHSQFIKIRQGFIFYTYTLYVISSSNVLKQFVYDKKIVSINACVCVYGCGVGEGGCMRIRLVISRKCVFLHDVGRFCLKVKQQTFKEKRNYNEAI